MSVWRLLPYQARWVADPAPIKVAVKSRRIGLSWSEAYDSVMRAAAGAGSVTYSSYAKDMTAGFVGDCADWAASLHDLALTAEEEVLEDDDRGTTTYRIKFPSGREIQALSSVPRALRSRGRPGDAAVLDEVAFTRNPDALLQAATANQIWGGTIKLISTHNGAASPWNALVEDIESGELDYSLHTVPFAQAVREGLYRRILEVQRAAGLALDPGADPAKWAWDPDREAEWVARIRASYRHAWMAEEELDCIPAPGAGTWITLQDYLDCVDAAAGRPELYAGGRCWLGYDVARRVNLAVIVALEEVGPVLVTRELVVMHDETFQAQRAECARLLEAYRAVKLAVDQTGMGEVQVEELQRRHGRARVEGIVLSGPQRLEVATSFRDRVEDAAIMFPPGRAVRDDIRSVRRAPGPAGTPRLYADDQGEGGHADRFWAYALATHLAARGAARYALHRLGDRPSRGGPRHPLRNPRGSHRFRDRPGGLA